MELVNKYMIMLLPKCQLATSKNYALNAKSTFNVRSSCSLSGSYKKVQKLVRDSESCNVTAACQWLAVEYDRDERANSIGFGKLLQREQTSCMTQPQFKVWRR
jgi:hypothetical protein